LGKNLRKRSAREVPRGREDSAVRNERGLREEGLLCTRLRLITASVADHLKAWSFNNSGNQGGRGIKRGAAAKKGQIVLAEGKGGTTGRKTVPGVGFLGMPRRGKEV